jgi:hypothetical protein
MTALVSQVIQRSPEKLPPGGVPQRQLHLRPRFELVVSGRALAVQVRAQGVPGPVDAPEASP